MFLMSFLSCGKIASQLSFKLLYMFVNFSFFLDQGKFLDMFQNSLLFE